MRRKAVVSLLVGTVGSVVCERGQRAERGTRKVGPLRRTPDQAVERVRRVPSDVWQPMAADLVAERILDLLECRIESLWEL